MSIELLLNKLPVYAKDVKLNLEEIFLNKFLGLSKQQLYTISITLCYALKNEKLLNYFRNDAKLYIDDAHFETAKTALAFMSQKTVYDYLSIGCNIEKFKSIDLKDDYPAKIATDKTECEMCLFAVSLIYKNTKGIELYLNKLNDKFVSSDAVASIVKLTSTLQAVAEILEIEALRTHEFTARGENI